MSDHVPRVTIGLPVWNGEKYLCEAIDSILAQTYSDFELVVSDNASTDETESICRRYARDDRRIRYLRSDRNRGCNWNLRRVFEESRGEYFKWAAHDDVLAPRFLERTVATLDRHPEAVLCSPAICLIDANGHQLPVSTTVPPGYASSNSTPKRFSDVLLGYWCHEFYGLVRSRAVQPAVRWTSMSTDKVVLAELALRGTFAILAEPLLFIRQHPGQISRSTTVEERVRRENPRYARLTLLSPRILSVLDYIFMVPRAVPNPLLWAGCYFGLGRYLAQPDKWRRAIGEVAFPVEDTACGVTTPPRVNSSRKMVEMEYWSSSCDGQQLPR